MAEFDPDCDDTELPDLADRDAAIRFLERNDVALPEGLTIEKIKSRGSWWAIDDESFSFRVERHPSGPFPSTSMTGKGMPTPARWHIRKRYTYHLTIDEWDVAERMREFDFSPMLLVDAEFEQFPNKDMWEQALARARDAEDPEEVLDEQLSLTEQKYRATFDDVPEDHIEEMLAVLGEAFRRRVGMD
ncbi:hypothetical protein [Halococcus salifodinae]|uniref:Uncharacterized protein n=1 Tax=Halococcus salifodinae DSM 8989 TaxID=1227456 RepID=M0MQS9_9EURY|nr:hypothetical protein [Halococcus salifodinae]EMA48062.1 hypothetical protein C450_20341 [Halococcus salifodinae DSM 8989]